MIAYTNGNHDYIAKSYLLPITEALYEYGISKGYTDQIEFYEDMAWGGLQMTTLWSLLNQGDRDNISVTLTKELKGRSYEQEGIRLTCY